MLRDAIDYLLNNPDKVDKQMYIGTAYFLQKENGKLRPIVLQETLTKIAHRCLNRRLLNMIQGKMPNHQFCINCPNGTTRAALEIQKEIKEGKAKYIVAADFTNAFNSISRRVLIKNMVRMGIDTTIINYVATYLERFAIKYGEKTIMNRRGVPQGCPLSMTLFATGTNHLIKIIEKKGVRVYAYADDMALIADSKEDIEDAIATLEEKARDCGLSLNREKTRYFTLGDTDEGTYRSLTKEQWTYLGIPISKNQALVREAFSKAVEEVAERSKMAWNAPLLQQAYFIEKLCGPMLTHLARGTDLQGETDAFLSEQQEKLEKYINPVIKKIPRAWRVQPVKSGGLGLVDIRLTQKAAREALLVEAGEKTPDEEILRMSNNKGETREGERWQKKFTWILQQLIIKEHKTKMRVGEEKDPLEPITSDPGDSLWLSSPPYNQAQLLSDTAFRIALQLRYGIDDIQSLKKLCPFCGKPLTLQHTLVCVKANQSEIISRHNTITRIIGTNIASTGTVVEYEKKLPIYSNNKPHIPDITYIKNSVQHHIDVAICQRHGKYGDMRQKMVNSKTYRYKKTWGEMFKNVHFVIFDNGGRLAEGVREYLKGLEIGTGTLKTMQSVILKVNESCYKRVMGRLAEEMNEIYSAKSKSMLLPLDLIEDTLRK